MTKILAFDCCDELGHVWLWVGANVLDDSPPPDDFMCKCGGVAWKDRSLTQLAPDRAKSAAKKSLSAAQDTSALAAARAVIAAFVYPYAPMTPAQREAWEAWENITGESHAT